MAAASPAASALVQQCSVSSDASGAIAVVGAPPVLRRIPYELRRNDDGTPPLAAARRRSMVLICCRRGFGLDEVLG